MSVFTSLAGALRTGVLALDLLLYLLISFGAISLLTYTSTWLSFHLGQMNDKGQKRRPLTFPYFVPGIGNAVWMLYDIAGLNYTLAYRSLSHHFYA